MKLNRRSFLHGFGAAFAAITAGRVVASPAATTASPIVESLPLDHADIFSKLGVLQEIDIPIAFVQFDATGTSLKSTLVPVSSVTVRPATMGSVDLKIQIVLDAHACAQLRRICLFSARSIILACFDKDQNALFTNEVADAFSQFQTAQVGDHLDFNLTLTLG